MYFFLCALLLINHKLIIDIIIINKSKFYIIYVRIYIKIILCEDLTRLLADLIFIFLGEASICLNVLKRKKTLSKKNHKEKKKIELIRFLKLNLIDIIKYSVTLVKINYTKTHIQSERKQLSVERDV